MIKTKRKYGEKDVYEVLQERLNYLFTEFDNIYVSFSGGKDSGLLLNLTLDFQKNTIQIKKLGYFIKILRRNIVLQLNILKELFKKLKMKWNHIGYVYLWQLELL